MEYRLAFSEVPVTADDARVAALVRLARQTFCETFTHYEPADLQAYLDTALSLEAFRLELADPSNRFTEVLVGGEVGGYLKWQYPTSRYQEYVTLPARRPCLLERFYFLPAFQGRGIADVALAYCLSWARWEAGADYLYLSVWEGNFRAQSFYQKHGFRTLGSFGYPVGQQVDREFVYGRPLAGFGPAV
jgi:ribosomal protein S18 acetylase RimI-like enzyme